MKKWIHSEFPAFSSLMPSAMLGGLQSGLLLVFAKTFIRALLQTFHLSETRWTAIFLLFCHQKRKWQFLGWSDASESEVLMHLLIWWMCNSYLIWHLEPPHWGVLRWSFSLLNDQSKHSKERRSTMLTGLRRLRETAPSQGGLIHIELSSASRFKRFKLQFVPWFVTRHNRNLQIH